MIFTVRILIIGKVCGIKSENMMIKKLGNPGLFDIKSAVRSAPAETKTLRESRHFQDRC